MSQFIEVEITISQLVHDLRAGLTWFASEDKGQGSIQAKYEMEDEDVQDIMSHPAFHQPIRTFKIIDDYSKKTAVQPVAVVEEEVAKTEMTFEQAPTAEQETESAGALEFLSL